MTALLGLECGGRTCEGRRAGLCRDEATLAVRKVLAWGGVAKALPLATSWEDGESQPSGVVSGSGATLSLKFRVERVL